MHTCERLQGTSSVTQGGSIWRQLCYQPWSPDLEPFLSTMSFYSVSLVQQTSLEKMLPNACTVHTVTHSPSHRWSDQGWAGQPWPGEQGWASGTCLPQEFGNLTWKLGDHIQNKWAEEADQNKKEWGAREREARKDFEMTDTAWLTREKEQPWFLMGFLFQGGRKAWMD